MPLTAVPQVSTHRLAPGAWRLAPDKRSTPQLSARLENSRRRKSENESGKLFCGPVRVAAAPISLVARLAALWLPSLRGISGLREAHLSSSHRSSPAGEARRRRRVPS